jgi:hypothetical protein
VREPFVIYSTIWQLPLAEISGKFFKDMVSIKEFLMFMV